jgi:sugar lactone lactonase YvrE
LRTGKHGKPPLHKKIRSIHTGTAVAFGLEQSKDGRFLFVADTAGVRVWNLHSPSPVLMGSFEMEFSEDTWAKFSVQTLSDNGYLAYLCVFSPSPR